MILEPGTKLGPYEILGPLGSGGMGEVYRAHDTRLGRNVAIKILPTELSADAARRQRFEREAKTISALNHPHICVLHDVGSQDGLDYLVMECLEGETLAKRLEGGPLPLDLCLKYGAQIASALDKAHRYGVVHRDLKPGNIMLTSNGAKLLDFGLAKPTVQSASLATLTAIAPAQSPVTREGTIVGTFQYMSPEQVEGKEVDALSDIFSLGAVLYEMHTGKKAFEGKTQLSIASAILEKEPEPISNVKPMTPPALDNVIRTCLAKLPEERWQSAADVSRQMRWLLENPPSTVITRQPNRRVALAVAAIACLAGIAGAFWLGWLRHQATPTVVQFQVAAPEKMFFNFRGLAGPPIPSPDGKKVVFVAYVQGEPNARSLWLRSLQSTDSQMIRSSEGATYPFWSPDSNSLAFFAEGKLKRFDLATSSLMTLCEAPEGRGGAWSTTGVILFGLRADSLFRVEATGGRAVRFTTLDPKRQEASHRWPQFLPDQKHFLYVGQAPSTQTAHMFVASLDSPQGKMLTEDLRYGYFSEGYMFYIEENSLVARRFEPDRLAFTGDATVLAHQVQSDPQFNFGVFAVTPSVLTYQTGAVVAGTWLVAADRSGKQEILWKETGLLQNVAVSPNGEQIAADIGLYSGQLSDAWIFSLPKHTKTRFTFDQHSSGPIWSPDGSRIAICRLTETGSQIVLKSVLGSGEEQIVANENQRTQPMSWTSDGRYVLYRTIESLAGEVKAVSVNGEHKVVKLFDTKSSGFIGSLSPDSKWLAYVSAEESSLQNVYVVPFHSSADGVTVGQAKYEITSGGNVAPTWRADGKELFFSNNSFMGIASVPVNASGQLFEVGPTRDLFEVGAHPISRFFAPSPDGQKFYAVTYGPGSDAPFTVTLNWQALLTK